MATVKRCTFCDEAGRGGDGIQKFRLYLTPKQERLILRTFGACRFVWNHYLAARKEIEGRTLNYYDCAKDMTRLEETFPWLRDVDSTAHQSSLRDLNRAYQNFFCCLDHRLVSDSPRLAREHHQLGVPALL